MKQGEDELDGPPVVALIVSEKVVQCYGHEGQGQIRRSRSKCKSLVKGLRSKVANIKVKGHRSWAKLLGKVSPLSPRGSCDMQV